MKMSGNTIFITGATSGIGLELAVSFSKLGNKVIISGRNESLLKELAQKYPDLLIRACDVSNEASLVETAKWLQEHHNVNVLINNAGIFKSIDLAKETHLSAFEEEIRTNYFAPLKLVSLLLPSLQKEKDPAIINVSSGLAYFPLSATPLYCATKAALHFYSISLRNQLKKTGVTVIEILPPAVDTKLTKDAEMSKMPLDKFTRKAIAGLAGGKTEIRIGQTRFLYYIARISPKLANYVLNK
jgi:uncharacterized oxidoreductase